MNHINTFKWFRLAILFITALLCAIPVDDAHAQDEPIKDYTKEYPLYEYITVRMKRRDWYQTFVGHNYRVPLDYTPQTLVALKDSKQKMDSRVAPHYNKMYDAAKADGVKLTPFSAYRSIEQQQTGFNKKIQTLVEQNGLEEEAAVKMLSGGMAYPGASEHNLGFCLDFLTEGQSGASILFAETEQFVWLVAHAADYGFILRYPSGKKSITGYNYEPWHWRYVGVKLAKKLKEKGICFDEYLGRKFLSIEDAQKLKEQGVSIKKYLRKQGKISTK